MNSMSSSYFSSEWTDCSQQSLLLWNDVISLRPYFFKAIRYWNFLLIFFSCNHKNPWRRAIYVDMGGSQGECSVHRTSGCVCSRHILLTPCPWRVWWMDELAGSGERIQRWHSSPAFENYRMKVLQLSHPCLKLSKQAYPGSMQWFFIFQPKVSVFQIKLLHTVSQKCWRKSKSFSS